MNSRTILELLLSFQPPGRRVEVLPDDIFLVSYPRSGSVWVRFLIVTLIDGRSSDFVRMNALLPDIYGASRRQLRRLTRPRLIKSHEYFDPRYRRAVYLVRDPRDVVVSYHEFQRREGIIVEDYPLSNYVERFVTGVLDRFGTWKEHVGSWLGARGGRADFLLVRYEDLKSATVSELRRVVEFIGLEADDAKLALAAELCSVGAMRRIEQVQAMEGVIDPRRLDRPGIRSGVAGGWRNQLDRGLEARITEAFHPLMQDLGYLDGSIRSRSAGPDAPGMRLRQTNV
jgi:hypothetical protein